MPRQPILSVLGHVDSGKTTLLDSIRQSRIVEGEEGGITQMIGATEVPLETVRDVCGGLLERLDTEITIPGLLFIDTPGHAAFSSLRKRGGSISDIAILVVDVDEGVQPQTEEAIRILKESETPFVIALNKIDRLPGWKSERDSFLEALKEQSDSISEEIDDRIYELMAELSDYSITVDRFDRVDDFRKKVAVVPISAMTGVGIPELLMVVSGVSQRYLSERLEVDEGPGKGTVLEVSQEEGLGTTVDVIHYDGVIRKEDMLVYGTPEGPRTTEIRALMEPRPLEEIRLDEKFSRVEKVEPASGVKIVGRDLEGVVPGVPIRTVTEKDIDEAEEEIEEELELRDFETRESGVVVKADSLGSLEAVMMEVQEREIPVKRANVGPVAKKDIVEVQNEDPEHRAILAFNIGRTVSGDRMLRDEDRVRVFQSNIIYEIVDEYEEWRDRLEEQKREKALEAVSRPAKIRVMGQHVFRSSNPAVVGVEVMEGVIKPGASIMDEDGDLIGNVKAVQEENESVDRASKGDEVAVSISNATFDRDFGDGDILYVDLSGREYRQLQELEDLLSRDEKSVLEEIVEIKDSQDPHWKIG